MTDLAELAKSLQEQVDVITSYLKKENLPSPSFIPQDGVDPMNTWIAKLPPSVDEARRKAKSLSWSIDQLLTPPVSHLSWTAFQYYEVVSLRIVIEKRIAFMIPVSSPGIPIAEIAEKSKIPENRIIHVLRQLTAVNIFREPSPRVFAHSTASAVLTAPEYSNTTDLLLHFLDEGYKSAGYLPEALELYADKFDKVQKPELRTAFNLAYKTDEHYFDWIYTPENIPKYGERFGRSMMGGARSSHIEKVVAAYDWTQFKEGDKLVDVGGGIGHVGVEVAKLVKPGVEVIVQDRPSVVDQGREIHGHIVTFQAHNFFDKQPVAGANVYYLRLILHDWPDSICQTILGNIVPVMNKDSKILIMDAIWQDHEFWACGKDDNNMIQGWSHDKQHMGVRTLHMLNKLGSKERSEKEWDDLLSSAGLKLTKIYDRSQWQSIIEAVKV